jgi:hypothetical protein
MINPYPHELSLGDVYYSPILLVYSPILLVAFLSFIAALITVMVLNKLKLTRYLYAPSYVFIAIIALYMVLIDTYWIKF